MVLVFGLTDSVSRCTESPYLSFFSQPRRRPHQKRRLTPLWLRPLTPSSTMMLEITGAKAVTPLLVPCLTFLHTCTANSTGRFVLQTFVVDSQSKSPPCISPWFSCPQTLDPYDRPWASSPTKTPKVTKGEARQTKPAKGTGILLSLDQLKLW